ncbi:MAG TPA: ABC transporter ATP-binding protein [Verrucomicrobiota bacterium]|nr:ABC transporter ATP-binding protein [Verrucomicrobiota bacterium]HNT16066.1 ABC transporter ATP-binding protein [Verrucomicrobiota bacterium]
MTAPVIEADRLQVRTGNRCVIDLERLQIPAGQITALMGGNGAGKTTLLRTSLGFVKPAGGEIHVLGCAVSRLTPVALVQLRRRIGYVAQLLPARSELPLTVREVVAIGRTGRAGLFRAFTAADWRVVDDWINRLGLGGLAERTFGEISGGEQRKTIIARAMAQQPELLLLDEPAANLDLGWRERMVETIQELHSASGLPIVLVCHELELLPPACRHVVLLANGSVLAAGAPEAVFTEERVASLYNTRLRVVHTRGRHAVLPPGGPDV